MGKVIKLSKVSSGRLYVFEGIDNVGKTSIINEICKTLENKSISYSKYSFPGKDSYTLGGLIYDFHHNKEKYIDYDINNVSVQLLHVAAHIDLLIRCIIPDLKQGKIVLLDRFWWSTYAYGIANGITKKQIDMIIAPELDVFKKIAVEKVFLIKRTQKTSEYAKNVTTNILKGYESLADRYQRSVHVVFNDNIIRDAVSEIETIILEQVDESSDSQLNLFSMKYPAHDPITQKKNHITVLTHSLIYDTYWKFAAKRQDIFFAKLNNQPHCLTADSILLKHKFTNAYRASDRVSQYLIKNVIYNNLNLSPEDTIFRIIMFKLFNKIETWETLEKHLGEITYQNYNFDKYDKILNEQLLNNKRIYSAAYIMPSGKSAFNYAKKHQNNLALLELIMKDRLSRKISMIKRLQDLYGLLIQYPTFGKFLAFQLSIDINYSELCDFSEMSFVVAGPGAQSGIRKCFEATGNYTDEYIIQYMCERQQQEFERLGLNFKTLWGRPLQLIDCQNLFCETDKYSRAAYPNIGGNFGRTRIKQLYKPSERGPIEYFYPPKWNINQYIK